MPILTELDAAKLAENGFGDPGSLPPDPQVALPQGFVERPDLAVSAGNGGGFRVFVNDSTGEAVVAFKGADGPTEFIGGAAIGVWGQQYLSVRDAAIAVKAQLINEFGYNEVIAVGRSGGGGAAQSFALDTGVNFFAFNPLPLSPQYLELKTQLTGMTIDQLISEYQAEHQGVVIFNSADIAGKFFINTPVDVNGLEIVLQYLTPPKFIVTPETFWFQLDSNHSIYPLLNHLNEINDLPVLEHFRLDDTLTVDGGLRLRFGTEEGGAATAVLNNDGTSTVYYTNADGSSGGETLSAAGQVTQSYTVPIDNSPVDNSLLTVTTNTDPGSISQEGAEDLTATANDITLGFLRSDATGLVSMPADMINDPSTGDAAALASSQIVADGIRIGNVNPADDLFTFFTPTDSTLLNGTGLDLVAAGINLTTNLSGFVAYTDPLVLDLNGDGVKLTDYAAQPVLFDIDHDGGSLEITGWVSAQDGIVVHDLNADDVINDMSETLSEYYNGTVGTGGNPGSQPFANGFAALASLDSNADGKFDSADTLFTTLRVWVDANSDGKTNAGELKTFSELSITQINLANTAQSGEVRDGNEVLARGTFVQSGQTKEALAANFLANPDGHTFTASGTGTIVTTQGGVTSYVTHSATGEVIDVAVKGVANLYGAQGNDQLIGDTANNWLAGVVLSSCRKRHTAQQPTWCLERMAA